MKLRNFLFLLAFGSIVITAPAFASDSPDSHDAQAEAGHDEGHAAGHGLNWFDFSKPTRIHSPPLIALLVNFALLVFLVYLLLHKGLSKRFKNRKETLETEIAEARTMKEEAEEILKNARAKMESLDAEMAKIKQDILDAGKAESTRVLEDAKATGERLSADAMAMVEQEVLRITQEIRVEVVEEVIEMAKQLVTEKMNTGDHDRIFGDYLNGITSGVDSVTLGSKDGEAS